MVVYVLNSDGCPLMPTRQFGKIRRLLDCGKAKVIKRCPFTVRLTYQATDYVQEITLGVDAGSKTIGLSASTEKEEYFSSKVTLRDDIVDNLSSRRRYRRSRRNRTTRYRKARFNNRVHSKNRGWLAPSVQDKIGSHIHMVNKACRMLPVSHITVETASFDIQKIKNPELFGREYQLGEQLGFWNIREYVIFRDGHECQCCHGRSKDKRLNVHHIESRKTGGNAPNNLITLCETCHNSYHQGLIKLPCNIKRGMKFKDAAFMGIMRWAFYNTLKEMYPGKVSLTYGYITKNTRIEHGLPKDHNVDALCIADHPAARLSDTVYEYKKVRCHNRQIHKAAIPKGGIRKRNQAPYEVKGFRLFDKVSYNGTECFIFGRRSTGYFDLRTLDGTHIHKSASYKQLKLLKKAETYLCQEEERIFLA